MNPAGAIACAHIHPLLFPCHVLAGIRWLASVRTTLLFQDAEFLPIPPPFLGASVRTFASFSASWRRAIRVRTNVFASLATETHTTCRRTVAPPTNGVCGF